jgi:hypothetical protein
MKIALYLILIALIALGNSKAKQKVIWGKFLMIISGFVLTIAALWNIFLGTPDVEVQYKRVQGVMLAHTLANLSGKNLKCLVVHSPFNPTYPQEKDEFEEIIEAFKDGFQNKLSEIKAIPVTNRRPVKGELEIHPEDFNDTLNANPGYDVIIFTIKLPNHEEDLMKIDLLNPEVRANLDVKPIIGVYNCFIKHFSFLIEEGVIEAATLWKPNPEIDNHEAPDNLEEAFNKRFFLLTPGNFAQKLKEFPEIFK